MKYSHLSGKLRMQSDPQFSPMLTWMSKIAPIRAAIGHVDAEDRDSRGEVVLVEDTFKLVPNELEALVLRCVCQPSRTLFVHPTDLASTDLFKTPTAPGIE